MLLLYKHYEILYNRKYKIITKVIHFAVEIKTGFVYNI